MEKFRKIVGKEWYEKLLPFFQSEEFKKIIKTINAEKEQIFPDFKYVFRAFKLCPYEKLKIVILTTNCFFNGEADGLAFSCGWSGHALDKFPIHTKIYDAIEEDLNTLILDRNPDLSKWAKQGVLLLNCDLTTIKGKPGSHIKLWRPFIIYLIKLLRKEKIGLVYTLMGKEASKYETLINKERNDYHLVEHPLNAVKEDRDWDHKRIFHRMKVVADYFNHPTELLWI